MEIPRSICREDALAPENTMVLRFILILAIFIFHAGIHMGFVTPDLGHVCVSVFFFLSGYGLEYSLDKALVFQTAGTLFVMFVLWYHFNDDLYYRSGMCFVMGAAWYLFRDSIGRVIGGCVPALVLLIMIPLLLQNGRSPSIPEDFVITSLSGALSCILIVAMMAVDIRKGWIVLVAGVVVSVILLDVTYYDNSMSVGPTMVLIACISSILSQIPVVSGAFVFLGGMSLELYLLHMNLLHYMFPNVTDSVLWSTVLAGIATLVLGYVMYRVCRYVLGRYNAAFERISANNTSI